MGNFTLGSCICMIVNDRLEATYHVINLLTSCHSLLYALRMLRTHGIPTASLHRVFRATVLAKIKYCSPAWSRLCSASDRARLDSFLCRCKRLGYCVKNTCEHFRHFQRRWRLILRCNKNEPEAGTHNSAKTHPGTFCDSWPGPLTFLH